MQKSALAPLVAQRSESLAQSSGDHNIFRWSNAIAPIAFVTADVVFLAMALVMTQVLSGYIAESLRLLNPILSLQAGIFVAFAIVSVSFFALVNAYDPATYASPLRDLVRIVGVLSAASMVIAFATLFIPAVQYGSTQMSLIWMDTILYVYSGRVLTRQALQILNRRGIGTRRVLIVGNAKTATTVARRLQRSGPLYEVMGLIDVGSTDFAVVDEDAISNEYANGNGNGHANGAESARTGLAGLKVLGGLGTLSRVVDVRQPTEVLLAVSPHEYATVRETIMHVHNDLGIPVRLALDPLVEEPDTQDAPAIGNVPAIQLKTSLFSWQYEQVKRAFDVFVTLFVLAAAAPFMALVAIAIKIDNPGPIFYRQVRIGRGGKPFYMYKFRSMKTNADALLEDLLKQNEASGAMFKMANDPRITRVGSIIRRLSIDELPQLFNVLNGTMSLVGPRPPLPREVAQYEDWHLQRLDAIPGITGLWQVKRGPISNFDEMVNLDVEYIQGWSLATDLTIILQTIPAVITAKGAM